MRSNPSSLGIWKIGVIILLVYYALISLQPVQWGDSGYYLERAINKHWILVSLHPMSHQFFQFLQKLIFQLFGSNGILLINVCCLATSLYVMQKIASRIQEKTAIDCRFIYAYAILHSVSWTVTHVEVYHLHVLLLLSGFYFLFDPKLKGFLLAGIFFGLSLAVHQMTAWLMLVFFVWLPLNHSRKNIGLFASGFIIGSLILIPAFFHNLNLGIFAELKLFFTGAGASNKGWSGMLFSFSSFSISALIFIAISCLSLFNPASFRFFSARKVPGKEMQLLWWSGIWLLLFAGTYNVSDRFTFLLPFLAISAVYAAIAVPPINSLSNSKLILMYGIPIALCGALVLVQPAIKPLKYELHNTKIRDEFLYYGFPWIKDKSAQTYAKGYFEQLKDKHPIYTDYVVKQCLQSYQIANPTLSAYSVLNNKEDLKKVNDSIVYLPRLELIDTTLFEAIAPAEIGFQAKVKIR